MAQGGGRRNNCFIATKYCEAVLFDNAAISENNRFKKWEVIVLRSLA